VDSDNFGTVSFTPGLELEIPVTQRWYLRSFANFGWGKELDSGDTAWIYYAGLKSRYTIPTRSGDWAILNSVYYAGYNPNSGKSDDLAAMLLGVEFRQPLRNINLAGEAIDLHWHFTYSFLADDVRFGLPDGTFERVNDQFEAGLAFSFRNRPFEFWFLKFDRLGLAYRFNSDGTFKAVTLNLRSWFTR